MRSRLLALAADAGAVLLFAAVGRSSHAEGLTPAGLAQTAWPFLAALLLGWLVVRGSLGQWPSRLWHGVPVWLSTVFGGMAFRATSGQGTALSFVAVATVVLGALLLGWRAGAALVTARRGGHGPGGTVPATRTPASPAQERAGDPTPR